MVLIKSEELAKVRQKHDFKSKDDKFYFASDRGKPEMIMDRLFFTNLVGLP